jgi:hypothetical protein
MVGDDANELNHQNFAARHGILMNSNGGFYQHGKSYGSRQPPPPSDAATATTATTATLPLSELEIASLFRLLSDNMLLHDPSRGTCCRNRCSGCAYLDPTSSDFACNEYTAAGGGANDSRPGGWLVTYVVADFGDRVHALSWGQILFPGLTDAADEDGDPEVAPPPLPVVGSWREIDSLC